MNAVCRTLLLLACAAGAQRAACQSFVYVDPGIASCPPAPTATAAAAKVVRPDVPVSGSIRVSCGFDQGSYTVTMNSTDPGATFSPKSFIVNFGRVAGAGVFTVRFANLGVQRVTTHITSNMGSPMVRGHFASAGSEFDVVSP